MKDIRHKGGQPAVAGAGTTNFGSCALEHNMHAVHKACRFAYITRLVGASRNESLPTNTSMLSA